jgi:hypothetical protein
MVLLLLAKNHCNVEVVIVSWPESSLILLVYGHRLNATTASTIATGQFSLAQAKNNNRSALVSHSVSGRFRTGNR